MPTRVMVFIDYWNFQLRLNQLEAREKGLADDRFKIDWAILGSLLAQKACDAVKITDHVFEGCTVYTSIRVPKKGKDSIIGLRPGWENRSGWPGSRPMTSLSWQPRTQT
jgi:hypothetical protein